MDLENLDFEKLHQAILSQRYEMTAQQPTVIKIGSQSISFNMNFGYEHDNDDDTDFAMVADVIAHKLKFDNMKHEELEQAILVLGKILSVEERQRIRDQIDYVVKEKKTFEYYEKKENENRTD